MQLAPKRIQEFCRAKRLSLNQLLKQAGVSKTAYYSLKRRGVVVPFTVLRLCKVLGVEPKEILSSINTDVIASLLLRERLEEIIHQNPKADRDNVWHTLLLLQDKPITRLNRALLRGSGGKHIH